MFVQSTLFFFFFFNDTATTEIYTLSLHDALPIYVQVKVTGEVRFAFGEGDRSVTEPWPSQFVAFASVDRKSTRLNSSHANISYAVFCLKKKKKKKKHKNKDNCEEDQPMY